MNERNSIEQLSSPTSLHANYGLRRSCVGVLGSLSAAALGLSLGLTGGCDPEAEVQPLRTFDGEVQLLHGELIREQDQVEVSCESTDVGRLLGKPECITCSEVDLPPGDAEWRDLADSRERCASLKKSGTSRELAHLHRARTTP